MDVPADQTCVSTRQLFARQVWPILSARCTGCHAPGGSAATGDNAKRRTAGFVLEWDAYPGFLDTNLAQISRMVTEQLDGVPKLLVKPTGGDTHLGGAPIAPDSDEYKLLAKLTQQIQNGGSTCEGTDAQLTDGVPLDDWRSTFRRAAIVLGGRLPRDDEKQLDDEAAFDRALSALLAEPGFATHIKETWNDVLLTNAGDQVQVNPFQYRVEDFPEARTWQVGPDPICKGKPDENLCVRDYYLYWNTVERAFVHEPLALIANVVAKNAPFSEILTADYAMVNPYSAVVYGVKDQFEKPSAETFSTWKEIKVRSAERGPVPHAGLLSTPAFLGRWVSTATNKNRARARMVYKSFLATDVLKLAQRALDTSELTGVANPPRNNAACSVCHSLVDPVATSFSNYTDDNLFDYDPTISAATNHHQEMLPPGFETERIPGHETRILPALSQLIVQDRRFALSVARIVYKSVVGREVLPYPSDPADPAFADKLLAWDTQDRFMLDVAKVFEASHGSYKEVVRAIVKSAFFRGRGAQLQNRELAVELGAGRLLSPEMLDRKIEAVTTVPYSTQGWAKDSDRFRDLRDRYQILYGGIDSLNVTQRLQTATPMVTNIAERMANELACKLTAWEFTRPAAERALLPKVERMSFPDNDEEKIRDNIVYLFERVLGERHAAHDAEIDAAYTLFSDTLDELTQKGEFNYLAYACQGQWERNKSKIYPCGKPGDPGYIAECYVDEVPLPPERVIATDGVFTIGAWMAVVSYVFSDVRFLYE